ncbi:MAG TPA: hypothetical protein P5121_25950 [Caldilineaceae bacterium]|nr:hypothetical protein [Caldilineaceae bacterium]HRW08583.1 hypothetical protein [Caldilineaceae bacterium]
MPTQASDSGPNQQPARKYRSFLLRCWRERDTARPARTTWRFSVREVGDDPNEYTLRSLGQLVDFVLEALLIATPGEKTDEE